MRLAELETALAALESEKKIKRIDFEKNGCPNQKIVLSWIEPASPEPGHLDGNSRRKV